MKRILLPALFLALAAQTSAREPGEALVSLLASPGAVVAAAACPAPAERGPDQDQERYEAEYLARRDAAGMLVTDKLLYVPGPDPVLTLAQQVAIAHYTITYEMEPRILLAGAVKLPGKAGVLYRGQRIGGGMGVSQQGQTISLGRIVSATTSKEVAAGFMPGIDGSEILVINARSARDISPYSQCRVEGIDEQEHFLLPGTRYLVNKIYTDTVTIFQESTGREETFSVRHVLLTEL